MTPQLAALDAPVLPSPRDHGAPAPAEVALGPAATESRARHAAPVPDGGRAWRAASLGSLTYTRFAVQQPGPLEQLRTREQVLAAAAPAPAPTDAAHDPFLRRQNVLGELSALNF